MATLKIKNSEGKDAGSLKVSDDVFGIEPNNAVMHQVVRAQRAALQQGTHATKTRSDRRGGGRKPYRQKGTGRARQGSIRSPHYRGGGVVFGPHPHSHAQKVNKKVTKLAMRSALSGKVADSELYVVDALDFDEPSTKKAQAILDALDVTGRITVVVDDDNINAFLSFRNIPSVLVIAASESNTYDLIDNTVLIMTTGAVKYVEEVLS
ncbi:MAG: 50S ribosomal protein L4 [Coriobacteriaceae bacterium]|nr:50S ribosomal protein L4 [Coriobacteriaceae bacterium]